jgi:hypothetical protein
MQALFHGAAHRGIIVYIEYQMSVPSSELGPPPLHSPKMSVSIPLDPKGGGQHSLANDGVRGPISDEWTGQKAWHSVVCILCGAWSRFNFQDPQICSSTDVGQSVDRV